MPPISPKGDFESVQFRIVFGLIQLQINALNIIHSTLNCLSLCAVQSVAEAGKGKGLGHRRKSTQQPPCKPGLTTSSSSVQ